MSNDLRALPVKPVPLVTIVRPARRHWFIRVGTVALSMIAGAVVLVALPGDGDRDAMSVATTAGHSALVAVEHLSSP